MGAPVSGPFVPILERDGERRDVLDLNQRWDFSR